MGLIVQPATPGDAEAVVAILNPIIEAGVYTAFDTPVSVEEERQYIENLPQRAIFHVALEDSKVVGFQSMEPFAIYTRAFDHVGIVGTYVDLARRRRGVGSRLFEATIRAAKEKGYRKLFTYIRADNAGALSAYAKQGFTVVGIARDHAKLGDRFVDEVIVEKHL